MKVSAATFAAELIVYEPDDVDVAAAVTEEPQQQLGLGLFAAERHAVADVALGLDLRGVGLQLAHVVGAVLIPTLAKICLL